MLTVGTQPQRFWCGGSERGPTNLHVISPTPVPGERWCKWSFLRPHSSSLCTKPLGKEAASSLFTAHPTRLSNTLKWRFSCVLWSSSTSWSCLMSSKTLRRELRSGTKCTGVFEWSIYPSWLISQEKGMNSPQQEAPKLGRGDKQLCCRLSHPEHL